MMSQVYGTQSQTNLRNTVPPRCHNKGPVSIQGRENRYIFIYEPIYQ